MDWILDNRVVLINVAYLIAAVCFIVGLKLLSSPATARRGNQIAALGMAIAVVATLFMPGLHNIWLILVGLAIGAVARGLPGTLGQDDRHAADGRHLQRHGRRHGGAGLPGRVPAQGGYRPRRDHLHRARRDHRLDLVLRQHDRLRQAAGADLRPRHLLPESAAGQRHHRHRGDRARRHHRRARAGKRQLRPHRRPLRWPRWCSAS